MSEQASQPQSTLTPAAPLFDTSQQAENVHHTTGYEPNLNLGTGALQGLGVPPPEIMAGGPEAQLLWYLSQQTRLGNGDPVPQATAAAHGTPPGLSQVLGGAPLALPFQGHWGGEATVSGAVGVPGFPASYSTLANPVTYPQQQNTGGAFYSPSFAFPIQQQQQLQSVQQPQFKYATPPGGSLFTGNEQGQQSMLSSLAGVAQAGASALNPLLQALVPQLPIQLIPNMPLPQSPPAYYTPQPMATPLAQPSSSLSNGLSPEMLQQLLQSVLQQQQPQVPPVPQVHQGPSSSEHIPVPDHDDPPMTSPPASVPLDVVLKLLETMKGQGSHVHVPVSREADRVVCSTLPTHMDYGQWRYAFGISVMTACPQLPQLIGPFLEEVSNPLVTDAMLVSTRHPSLTSVDMKIFSTLVQLLMNKPSDDTARMLSTIRTACVPGCGRQALRVFDCDFMHQGPQRRQVALVSLHNMKPCNEPSQVEPTIVQLRSILMELRGSAEMPSDAFVMGMIRTFFSGINKLSPIFMTFVMIPNLQPQ